MENKLVSIIVPVYNVEKYLERCVLSLLQQTYSNVEILLIDDGSSDNSSNMCDEYAKKNKNIKTFHKNNGGLSDARNFGLSKAIGEYIYYVDSDDWLENKTIEILVKRLEKEDADMAVGGIIQAGESRRQYNTWYSHDIVFNQREALVELLRNECMASHACNKLFKRKIIEKYQFPKGKLYEDLRIMHKIFLVCKKVAVTKEYLYYYYQRDDSISNTHNLKNDFAYLEAYQIRYNDLKDLDSEYEKICYYQLAYAIADVFLHNKFSREDKETYREKIDDCLDFLKSKKLKKLMTKFSNKNKNSYIKFVKIFKTKSRNIYLLFKGVGKK